MQTVCFHLYHISLLAIYFIFCMDIFFILSFLLHCSFSRSRCTIDLNKRNKTSTSRISIRITCFYFQKVTLRNRYSEKRHQSSKYGKFKPSKKNKQNTFWRIWIYVSKRRFHLEEKTKTCGLFKPRQLELRGHTVDVFL